MDLGIVGILDIIILIGLVIFIVIGYKKSFSKKILSPFTILLFIGISIVFCGQLAGILITNKLDGFISNGIYEKLSIVKNATGYKDLIVKGLNIWEVIAGFLANGISKMGDFDIDTAATYSTEYITKLILTIMCFVFIFVALVTFASILRAIGKKGKTNKVIRVIDGVLGVICYVAIWAVIVCVLFYGLSLVMDKEWFSTAKEWFYVDMKLDDDSFRISKIIYEGNFLKNIIEFFVG